MKDYPMIMLSCGSDFEFCHPTDIIYCMSEGNYTKVYYGDAQCCTSSKKLKDIEEVLPPELFFRVHHSFLINIMYAKKFYSNGEFDLELKDGKKIMVSRRRKSAFLAKFLKL